MKTLRTIILTLLATLVVTHADPANNSLCFIVTGAGAAAVRWVAHVRTVEVRL